MLSHFQFLLLYTTYVHEKAVKDCVLIFLQSVCIVFRLYNMCVVKYLKNYILTKPNMNTVDLYKRFLFYSAILKINFSMVMYLHLLCIF